LGRQNPLKKRTKQYTKGTIISEKKNQDWNLFYDENGQLSTEGKTSIAQAGLQLQSQREKLSLIGVYKNLHAIL
jgi:hypothetical protein